MLSYEEMGKLPADRSVIPASCLTYGDAAMYVAEAAQRYFNEFFEEVGIEELAIFESTRSIVVYEGAKLDAFKEKLAEIWDKIWKAIKGAFEKIINTIRDLIERKQKEAGLKLTKLTAADIKAIDSEKFKSKFGSVKYKDYSKAQELLDIKEQSNPNYENLEVDAAKDKAEAFIKNIYSDYDPKKKATSLEDLKVNARDYAEDGKSEDIKQDWLASNIDKINKQVEYALDAVKKGYREAKKAVDDAKKGLRKIKDSNIDSAKYSERCKLNNIMAWNGVRMVGFDIQKKELKQNLSVLRAANALSKKQKAKHESYNFVDEAFDW